MLIDMLRQEFDQEAQATRRVLERVPSDTLDWKPHAKSMSLGALATHIANLSYWVTATMTKPSLDLSTVSQALVVPSAEELLALFDRYTAEAREELAAASDASLFDPWRLHKGDATLFELPRGVVLRQFVFNHVVHHRGQLTVYLRMLDVALPALYGPSADEMPS